MLNNFFKRNKIILFFFCLTSLQVFGRSQLFIPQKHKAKAPLLIALHGCLSSSEDIEEYSKFSDYGEQFGFFVFYPELKDTLDKSKCWDFYDVNSQKPGTGDAGDIMNAVAQIKKDYPIDDREVYVVGMSAGASLVNLIASCYPDDIAGIAVHSGMAYGLPKTWQEATLIAQVGPFLLHPRNKSCNPKNYKGKVLIIHGSNDNIMNPLHYSQNLTDYFFGSKVKKSYVQPINFKLGYIHDKFYRNNKLIGHGYLILGMAHQWSGRPDILDPAIPLGPDASRLMVNYFFNGGNEM